MPLNGRIWVTRAEPGASATAERLRALGLEPLVSPVLEVRPLDAAIDTDGAAALAFTSANAVRAFAARAPGRVARPARLRRGRGDRPGRPRRRVRRRRERRRRRLALARLIAARQPGLVLNPTAAEPAADLAALLAPAGVPVRTAALYETAPRRAGPGAGRAGRDLDRAGPLAQGGATARRHARPRRARPPRLRLHLRGRRPAARWRPAPAERGSRRIRTERPCSSSSSAQPP